MVTDPVLVSVTVPLRISKLSATEFAPLNVRLPTPFFTSPSRMVVGLPGLFWIVPEKLVSAALLTNSHLLAVPPFSIVPLPLSPPTVKSLPICTLPP